MTIPDLSSLSDDDLVAFIGGYYEYDDPAVVPDPGYLMEQRRLFVDLCGIYGAGNITLPIADDELLLACPPIPPRPIDACADLGQLAGDAYGGAL